MLQQVKTCRWKLSGNIGLWIVSNCDKSKYNMFYSCFALHSREWRDLHSINKIDDRNVLCSGSSTLSQTSLLNRFCFPKHHWQYKQLSLMNLYRHLYLPICNLVKVVKLYAQVIELKNKSKTTHCAEHLPGLISVCTVQPWLSELRLLENLKNL